MQAIRIVANVLGRRMTTVRMPVAEPVVPLRIRQVMCAASFFRQESVIATKRRGRRSASLRTGALEEPLTLVVVQLVELGEHETVQSRHGMG